ncbi:MAG: site-specific integrase [Candidatus Omnitrophota bacterium]
MRQRYRMPKSIYPRGNWYCFKVTTSYGKRVEVKSATMEEARKKRNDIERQIFSAVSGDPSYRVSLEHGIGFWLKIKKGSIDDTSYDRYRGCLDNFLDYIKAKRSDLQYFDQIKAEDIKAFMDYRIEEKGRATKTVNSERLALYNLFLTLIKHKKIEGSNPVENVDPLKMIKVQKRHALSDEELLKFLEGAKAESGAINWYAIFLTLYITGMRRDEVRKMEKTAIDLSRNLIIILNTKTDKPKIIPIHPELRPVLQQALGQSNSGLVFPNSKGGLLHKNKIRDKMIQICERVGIPKATVHDLRHTFASRPELSGMAKQLIGGWSSKQVMEKTYIHAPEDYVRDEYFKVKFIPKAGN